MCYNTACVCDLISDLNYSEEILNPSVPMALRLSGILMGNWVYFNRSVYILDFH